MDIQIKNHSCNRYAVEIFVSSLIFTLKIFNIELADTNVCARQRIIQAGGALELKLKAPLEVQKVWAETFRKYTGAVVPQIQTGGGATTNGALNFMDIMTAKAAKNFALDLKNKTN